MVIVIQSGRKNLRNQATVDPITSTRFREAGTVVHVVVELDELQAGAGARSLTVSGFVKQFLAFGR